MEFEVTLRIKEPGRKKKPVEWEPVVVEAEDKWDALVKVMKMKGLLDVIPASMMWRMASIRKTKRRRYLG